MRHRTTARFWACFGRLPEAVQAVARRNFNLLTKSSTPVSPLQKGRQTLVRKGRDGADSSGSGLWRKGILSAEVNPAFFSICCRCYGRILLRIDNRLTREPRPRFSEGWFYFLLAAQRHLVTKMTPTVPTISRRTAPFSTAHKTS